MVFHRKPKVDETSNMMLDDLSQAKSDDRSVYTLESAYSVLRDSSQFKSKKYTSYQMHDLQTNTDVGSCDLADDDDPYGAVYQDLLQSLSADNRTFLSNATGSLDEYDAYLSQIRGPVITESEEEHDYLDDRNDRSSSYHRSRSAVSYQNDSASVFNDDESQYSAIATSKSKPDKSFSESKSHSLDETESAETEDGGECCFLGCGAEDTESDDVAPEEYHEEEETNQEGNVQKTERGNLSLKKSSLDNDERAIRKERLKKKLSQMDPDAARAFKKKLQRKKLEREKKQKALERKLNKKGYQPLIPKELVKMQDEYQKKLQDKKDLKKSQKMYKNRQLRKEKQLENARKLQQELEANVSDSSYSSNDGDDQEAENRELGLWS